MEGLIRKFERLMTSTLLILMSLVVLLSIGDLVLRLVADILSPPVFLIEMNELLEIFGFFLLVMIGLELLETLKVYKDLSAVRAEVILLVALIAISRKMVTIELKEVSGVSLLGLAALILSLGVAYSLIKRSHRTEGHDLGRGTPVHQVQGLRWRLRKVGEALPRKGRRKM